MGYPWLPVVWCVITLTHMKLVIDSPKSHFPGCYRRPLAYSVPGTSPISRAVSLLGPYTDRLVLADCTQPLAHEVVSDASLDQNSAGLIPVL